MTVVKDALLAMESGGVTAMHDATEGGVIAGSFEIANASGVGMEIHEEAFVYPEEVRMVCEAFGIDPLAAIAEGSLLITVRPNHSKAILHKLSASGIKASVIGRWRMIREQKQSSGATVRSFPWQSRPKILSGQCFLVRCDSSFGSIAA